MSDKLTENAFLPWEELGRVTRCVIESVPAIGAKGRAPEAYVPGAFQDLILKAVNSYDPTRARIKVLEEALREIEKWSHKGAPKTSTILPGCSGCMARKALNHKTE